jgi:hypothetical protein
MTPRRPHDFKRGDGFVSTYPGKSSSGWKWWRSAIPNVNSCMPVPLEKVTTRLRAHLLAPDAGLYRSECGLMTPCPRLKTSLRHMDDPKMHATRM